MAWRHTPTCARMAPKPKRTGTGCEHGQAASSTRARRWFDRDDEDCVCRKHLRKPRTYRHTSTGRRRAYCTECHWVLEDEKPSTVLGLFRHPTHDAQQRKLVCSRVGRSYTTQSTEIRPFG